MTSFLELTRHLTFVRESKIIVVSAINATVVRNSSHTKQFSAFFFQARLPCNLYSEQVARLRAARCPALMAVKCKRLAHKQLRETETRHTGLARTLRMIF